VNSKKERPVCRLCDNHVKRMTDVYCQECIAKGDHTRWVQTLEDAKTDTTRKRILEEQRGHQCEKCGNVEWMGKSIPIELHHRNGNSGDSSGANLVLLCPNCHAQTSTYKNRNKGNGRYARAQRRRDGKSY